MAIEWHTEFCCDDHCCGECHETTLVCDSCGDDEVFEEGEEEAHVGSPCDCGEGTLQYPGSFCDEQAAERRQMGLSDF